jgi:effector-binding domain-containing protein
VSYEVRTEPAVPRQLAAVRAVTTPPRLSACIIGSLDKVWPLLREQGARTGHNVVIYHASDEGTLTIDAGVEVFGGFTPSGEVRSTATPAGEAAAVAHYGEYSAMQGAYDALAQWCTGNDRTPAGVNWEIYGDWAEDPRQRRTDIYFLLGPARPHS